jgi:hypothetical protein
MEGPLNEDDERLLNHGKVNKPRENIITFVIFSRAFK